LRESTEHFIETNFLLGFRVKISLVRTGVIDTTLVVSSCVESEQINVSRGGDIRSILYRQKFSVENFLQFSFLGA
jgi:hypothetical protein